LRDLRVSLLAGFLTYQHRRYSRSLLSGLLLLGSTGEAAVLDDAESPNLLR
jgi:dihydrodipicolinate synthase/N-acetylneuraminate lyase